jgi:hypothetical protein
MEHLYGGGQTMMNLFVAVIVLLLLAGEARAQFGNMTMSSSSAPGAPATCGMDLLPHTVSIPNNATGGTVVTPLTVVMAGGGTFSGSLAITSDPSGLFDISGMNLIVKSTVNLGPGNNGPHVVGITPTC